MGDRPHEGAQRPMEDLPRRGGIGRRDFLKRASVLSAGLPLAGGAMDGLAPAPSAPGAGVGVKKDPAVIKVGYVRHPGSRGRGWPGHGFDNDIACRGYSDTLRKMGQELGAKIDLTHAMITDDDQADRFIAAAKEEKPDALLIVPLGIFAMWQRARKILDALDVPTIVFTPIGSSFTMDTAPLAHKPGVYLVSSLEIGDVRPGMEMVRTAKILKQSTMLVLGRNGYQGTVFEGDVFGKIGLKLEFLDGKAYIDEYHRVPVDDDVQRLARRSIEGAKAVREVTREDIVQAARHYFASKRLLAEHGADGLTSTCLSLCGQVGTPCLGFSRLMDEGIPAGCESDIGSGATMFLIHNLLGRPGYMADPFVDTTRNLFGNAHCNCPTKLDGFDGQSEPYVLRSHHAGGHWVSVQTLWRIGQVFTLTRFQRPDLLLVDRAKVVCNYESPPAAACITNVGAVVEGVEDDPHKVAGFHVLQVYGDHVKKLRDYAQLYGIEAVHSWDPRISFDFEPNCA